MFLLCLRGLMFFDDWVPKKAERDSCKEVGRRKKDQRTSAKAARPESKAWRPSTILALGKAGFNEAGEEENH